MSTDLREQLQATLGSNYTLGRELGGGGMSRVFVAQDARLGRRVVVKVLHPDLGAAVSAERFEREVRLAARLQHPHVVPLFTAGETGRLLYYTMPYIEGESLRQRLARERPLPLSDAVRLVRELADALDYAHRQGVVHRDLKPENVLLSGGHATVADFGIAKALSAATTAAGSVTATNAIMGTPLYMAPEQAAGDPATDHRADLYALGLIAYELLTGVHPFADRPPQAVLAAQLTETPAPLAERRVDAPPVLGALVARLLAKSPDDRPQTAGEVLRLLDTAQATDSETRTPVRRPSRHLRRRVAAGVVVLSLAVLAALTMWVVRRPSATESPVLVVLPFENLGPASDQYFADGLTDEMRGRLSTVPGLRVIGGTSARQYKGSTKGARQIARELGATHLLTGTVRWDRAPNGAGRVRVSPELVRASDQASVWGEPFEGPLDDVFAMQVRVAERVAGALDVALLTTGARTAARARTPNPAAYDEYLRGLAHAAELNRFSELSRRAAIEAFERATAVDPSFAAAHARLANAYLQERDFGRDSGMLEKARSSLTRAMELDSTLAEAQRARAHYVLASGGAPDAAYRALRAAERAAPGDAEIAYRLSEVLQMFGREEEALRGYQRAAQLEPRSSVAAGAIAAVYDRLFRYEEALPLREREVALSPPHAFGHLFLAASHLLWRGDTAAARRALERGDSRQVIDLLTRMPSHFAGRAIWVHVVPPAVLAAKDTLTLAGYLRGDWGTPDLFHLMKARHFALTGRPQRARAHADSIIALVEPTLGDGPGAGAFLDLFSQRTTLAEAYAYAGRKADAARLIDRHLEDMRRSPVAKWALRVPYALVTAAYVDVLIGRRDIAVTRLEEALRLPSGQFISPALLRADPSWAPLRGHPGFERLIARTD